MTGKEIREKYPHCKFLVFIPEDRCYLPLLDVSNKNFLQRNIFVNPDKHAIAIYIKRPAESRYLYEH